MKKGESRKQRTDGLTLEDAKSQADPYRQHRKQGICSNILRVLERHEEEG